MNDLLQYTIDYSLCEKIHRDILITQQLIPLQNHDFYILIASSQKNYNKELLVETFKKPIKCINVSALEINKEIQYLDLKIKLYQLASKALQYIDTNDENSYIINFIDELLLFSMKRNVSDIHFESLYESVVIRLRIDGELNQIFRFEGKLFTLISSIIKYFGNLDISQKRIPLNGRFSKNIDGTIYDLRISTMPTIYGESIVLRILDNGNIQKNIEAIGFDAYTLQTIKKMLRLHQGLVLVTGPTGSGKTTSLYSMINSLNTKNKKIITIEDPVEYKLDGVMQVNINDEINLNYELVLKNILRQDPDILLIGEIRDLEALKIAIQASLTGHLVIATLHTNSALETLTRLLDLQAEPYLIASTLKMVLSQRLLKLLCPKCKVKNVNGKGFLPNGCEECDFVGYKNRQIISEVLEIDQKISSLIGVNKSIDEIQEYITSTEFRSLHKNGIDLVNNGLTTLEEYYSKV